MQLLLWHYASEHVNIPDTPRKFFLAHGVQFRTGNDLDTLTGQGAQPNLLGNALGCSRVVAGNHNHPNPRRVTFLNRCWNRGADWILQTDKP